jgi:hypothetical protein
LEREELEREGLDREVEEREERVEGNLEGVERERDGRGGVGEERGEDEEEGLEREVRGTLDDDWEVEGLLTDWEVEGRLTGGTAFLERDDEFDVDLWEDWELEDDLLRDVGADLLEDDCLLDGERGVLVLFSISFFSFFLSNSGGGLVSLITSSALLPNTADWRRVRSSSLCLEPNPVVRPLPKPSWEWSFFSLP